MAQCPFSSAENPSENRYCGVGGRRWTAGGGCSPNFSSVRIIPEQEAFGLRLYHQRSSASVPDSRQALDPLSQTV